MSESPFKYRRLPGRGRRTHGFTLLTAAGSTLWLGPDHLLSVDRIWVNEEYKRFYFRDIQAITVQRTNRSKLWNSIYAALVVICGLLFGYAAMATGDSSTRIGWLVAGGIITGLWLMLFINNFVRGPSCLCHIRTAVQTEVLPSLGRLGSATAAIAILKPLIEQAQGALSPGSVAAPMPPRLGQAPPSAPAVKPGQPPPRIGQTGWRQERRPENLVTHTALFAALLANAGVGFYSHLHPNWPYYLFGSMALLLALTASSTIAFVKQRDSDLSEALRSVTTFAFIFNLTAMFVLFIFGTVARTEYMMQHPGRLPSSINFYAMGGFKTLSLIADFIELGLGIAGVILLLLHLSRRAKPPHMAPASPDQPQTRP